MKPTVCDHDVKTGESIIREMTDEEYTQYLKDKENNDLKNNPLN